MRLAKANAKAADALKSAIARGKTHCKYGHSLADAYISRQLVPFHRDYDSLTG